MVAQRFNVVRLNTSSGRRLIWRQSSGVILDFKPQVFRDVIRVNFQQTISSFVKTETGINNSPTLIKREAKSDIDLTDGEVFVLGGLTDSKESNGRSSFPVPWLSSFAAKNANSRNTELLIILKVQKVKRENLTKGDSNV
ncbi:hypothetical protein [Undibacterium sp. Ji22W]|uniref:hypothetical protein n=1 Tax=Undibacterium sp. Ji22W TaxID=3413038 RepID=UPI003BF3BD9E